MVRDRRVRGRDRSHRHIHRGRLADCASPSRLAIRGLGRSPRSRARSSARRRERCGRRLSPQQPGVLGNPAGRMCRGGSRPPPRGADRTLLDADSRHSRNQKWARTRGCGTSRVIRARTNVTCLRFGAARRAGSLRQLVGRELRASHRLECRGARVSFRATPPGS